MTKVRAEVLRKNYNESDWTTVGSCEVAPGEENTLGSGDGPFFTVTGVSGGARFQHPPFLDATLRVQGTSNIEFPLMNANKPWWDAMYRAMVS